MVVFSAGPANAAGLFGRQMPGNKMAREVMESDTGIAPHRVWKEEETLVTEKKPPLHFEIEKPAAVVSYSRKRLLEKTIRDMDAYRVMLKNIGAHNDEYSRIILVEEADHYVEKFADPLLNSPLSQSSQIFNLIASLKFFKASIFYEAGNYDKYREILKDMEKEYGKKHLSVALFASHRELVQYKEMREEDRVRKTEQNSRYLSASTSKLDEKFYTIGEAIEELDSRLSRKKWAHKKF